MSQEWISQSNVIKQFKLNIYDLQSNIAKVVDETKSKRFESDVKRNPIEIAKNPLVALTIRLVDNPRGYEAPMKLYNISQIRDLETNLINLNRIHNRTPVPSQKSQQKTKVSKKQINKKIKNTAETSLKLRELKNSCETLGHDFEVISESLEVCKRCKMPVESETI